MTCLRGVRDRRVAVRRSVRSGQTNVTTASRSGNWSNDQVSGGGRFRRQLLEGVVEGRATRQDSVEPRHFEDAHRARVVRHEDECVTATLQTLRLLNDHPECGRVDEADTRQVHKDRIRPHGGRFVDPLL
jgi:hypothetical protein